MYLKKPYFGDWKLGDKFGMRFHPIEKIEKMHNGQDIKMPTGTKLYAPMNGKAYIHEDQYSGKYIVINSVTEQAVRVQFIFCHLSEILVKDGQSVSEWQEIGLSGSTGMSTGPHLHFAVKIWDAKKQEYLFDDPLKYFNFGMF
jgi:murein DD-endopeptidase MepM/ murein hydrolase activator NlpD